MKLSIIFFCMGPYHHARLHAVAKKAKVVAIECSSLDRNYAWNRIEGSDGFEKVTLFQKGDIEEKSIFEVTESLHSALNDVGPDAVGIPGWSAPYALATISWCSKNRVPLVLMSETSWGDSTRRPWREAVKRRIVGLCGAALVGGTRQVEYMEHLGMPRERILMGYDVVDNEYFAQGSKAVRREAVALREKYALPEHYFLASCRFVVEKNLLMLLEAYARYRTIAGGSPWELVILGDGELRSLLKQKITDFGIGSAVHLPGFTQYDKLPVYYGLAGTFVHPSTTEPWGLVVNEAMASGLPVLVSNQCGCAADLVEEGRNGFAFDPYDVDELAGKLLELSSNGCDRAAMGRASEKIISLWSPDTFAENMQRAVDAAFAAPIKRVKCWDRGLLWALLHR